MSIAKSLDGKRTTEAPTPASAMVNNRNGLYVFEDGSVAIQLTKFDKTEPYLASSLSTMSIKSYKVWKAL